MQETPRAGQEQVLRMGVRRRESSTLYYTLEGGSVPRSCTLSQSSRISQIDQPPYPFIHLIGFNVYKKSLAGGTVCDVGLLPSIERWITTSQSPKHYTTSCQGIYYLYLMLRCWGMARCPPLDESIKVKGELESKPLIRRDEFDMNLWSTMPFILLFSIGEFIPGAELMITVGRDFMERAREAISQHVRVLDTFLPPVGPEVDDVFGTEKTFPYLTNS
eukprot:Gb_23668 [translate_table: standard]